MEKYTDISKKYLFQDKKKSLYTIIGCALVAMIIFAFLNTLFNYFRHVQQLAREENDWEICIYNDDKDTAEAIINESFVRSALMGEAVNQNVYYITKTVTANSIFINVKNIHKVRTYGEYLKKTYNVDIDYNDEILSAYLVDRNSSLWIAIIFSIFIAYVFAIIGIGIIRNSISIAAIERLKDYGEMRCIGATKRQIKNIVFHEVAVLESLGILAGIAAGFLISIFLSFKFQLPVSFNFTPAVIVAVCFYFDLIFVVDEGTKKIVKISPVEAVRGHYTVKQSKAVRQYSGIWGLIFGIEGSYAYKNLRRNRMRYFKSIAAISFGIAATVVIMNNMSYIFRFENDLKNRIGYFQGYEEGVARPYYSVEKVKANLISPDEIRELRKKAGVEEVKYLYMTYVYLQDAYQIEDMISEDYEGLMGSRMLVSIIIKDETGRPTGYIPYSELNEEQLEIFTDEEKYQKYVDSRLKREIESFESLKAFNERLRETEDGLIDYDQLFYPDGEYIEPYGQPMNDIDAAEIKLYGYDKEDMDRYKDHLVDGTLDVSENGIVLVNGGYVYRNDLLYDSDALMASIEYMKYTDLKVGDTITIVDPEELARLSEPEFKRAQEFGVKKRLEDEKWHEENKDDKSHYKDYQDITENAYQAGLIIDIARQKLIREGKCKTFVIEGIVDMDVNHDEQGPVFVMPMENYKKATGKTEDDFSGFNFRINDSILGILFTNGGSDVCTALGSDEIYGYKYETDRLTSNSVYIYYFQDVSQSVQMLFYTLFVVVIIVSVNCLNIYNVAMSNIALRRNEFAQLRAIGMTKKGLYKAVVLEGVIVWFMSCIIGSIIGIVLEYFIYKEIIVYFVETLYFFNFAALGVVLLIFLLVLVGTYYFPLKRLKMDVASELTRSGE